MGCCQARIDLHLSEEERHIIDAEQLLGISEMSCDSFNTNIRFFSSQVVELTSLKEALNKSGIPKSSLKDDSSLIKYAIKHCSEGEGISKLKILMLSLLLCSDDVAKKINILYDITDLDCGGSISPEEFEVALDSILDHALVFLPNFGCDNYPDARERILGLMDKYWKVKKGLTKYFIQVILRSFGEISKSEFEKSFNSDRAQIIFSSKKLREYALTTFNRRSYFDTQAAKLKVVQLSDKKKKKNRKVLESLDGASVEKVQDPKETIEDV